MTRVLPFRAFKCAPAGGAARREDGPSAEASIVTCPEIEPEGAVPLNAIPIFGEGAAGGFLVLRHDYSAPSGVRKTRLALVALLEPLPGSEGAIKAALDVEPRDVTSLLAELERGRTQAEPVVAAYEEPRLELDKLLEKACLTGSPPELDEEGLDGDRLRFWKIADRHLTGEIIRFFEDREVYVVDGLHVYRACRRLASGRGRSQSDAENREPVVCPLTIFANLCDFGVSFTAHHLLVRDLLPIDINRLILELSPFFELKSYPLEGAGERSGAIKRFREELRVPGFTGSAIGAYFRGNPHLFLLRLREDVDRCRLFLPDVRPEEQSLDAFLLRRVLLDRYMRSRGRGAAAARDFEYARTIEEAIHSVRSERCGAAFFLNPPTKRELSDLLREGLRLPPGALALDPPVPSGLVAHIVPRPGASMRPRWRVAARNEPMTREGLHQTPNAKSQVPKNDQ